MAEAKAARETYEYGIATTVEKTEAEMTLSNAKEFVNVVKKYLEERAR